MKRFRVFYGGLAGLAAACALGAWFAPVEAGWLAFPWGSIGAGLRVLSLSGSVGNVAACGLYALLCLLPAGIALRDIRHHWPLVGFSAVLGPALYFLINPGLLAQRMGGLPQEVVVAMLGQLIWAAALACAVWLLLGALHRRSLNTSSLLHGIQIGLCLLDGAFVVSVFGVGLLDLRGQIAAVRQANTMLDNTAFGTLNPTALFLVCGWLVQSLALYMGCCSWLSSPRRIVLPPAWHRPPRTAAHWPAELRRWMLQYKQCFWQYSFAPPGSCTS